MSDAAATATNTAPPPAPPRIPLLTPESFEGLVHVVEALAAMADMLGEANRIPLEPELEQRIRTAGALLVAVERQHEQLSDNALAAWAARASMLAVVSGNLAAKILAELHDRNAARQAVGAIVAPDGVTPAAAAVAEQSTLVGPDLRPVTSSPPAHPPHLVELLHAQARERRGGDVVQIATGEDADNVFGQGSELAGEVRAHIAMNAGKSEPPVRGIPSPGSPLVAIENGSGIVRIECHACNVALGEVSVHIADQVARTHLREKHSEPLRVSVGGIAAVAGLGPEVVTVNAAAGERVTWMHPSAPDPTGGPYDEPTCKRCGCTEGNACTRVGNNGTTTYHAGTCSWAELNPETNAGVCTACAE